MRKNEIVFVLIVLALMFSAYFFIQRKISPPENIQTRVLEKQRTQDEYFDMQMEYYETHADVIELKNEREIRKNQKILDKAKPQLKKAEEYNKEWEEISKLPQREQEKRLKEMVEKGQKESGKNKKFRDEKEIHSYYESLRKKYPKEYSKYKKMIENE